jgi:peptide/nickel transport system permease protein
MSKYILKRLLQIPPLVFGITIITFLLINLAPGDPISAMIDPEMLSSYPVHEIDRMRRDLGLDQPIPVRYVLWLRELAQGNLGYSYQGTNLSISKLIMDRLPATLLLTVSALALAASVGIALGVISALRQYTLLDNALTITAFIGISVPGYFFALLGAYVFAASLRWLPVSGMWTPGLDTGFNLDLLRHMILPVGSLAILHIAGYMRYTRTAVLEVLGSDYIVTARAKGLHTYTIQRRHVFRNALLPLVTLIGLELPSLIGGAFIIESTFAWPGIGSLAYNAILRRDYPLQMAVALIMALAILLANLLTDIAYTWVDPRIRYE